jgi:TetR/AcrR family transcriptional repressor of nem operon
MPRPKSFDESAVLDRAVQLFWQRGYEGTSMSDLEEHLGLGRQSLYNAFGDKHELFQKALQRYREWGAQEQLALLTGRNAGLEAVRTFFDRLIVSLTPRGSEPRRACFIANSALELAGHCEATRGQCTRAEDAAQDGFRHALANAARRGELRPDVDVHGAATMLVTQMYGLSVMAKLGNSREEMRAAVEAMLAGLS